ncbi:cache domain-containing sensor histidine kinase [Clostridium tarantellae]|uniref:HAMP domain-containing protein n=1 Tax=Clostridium tarantellae TaxID=39493 RepID=A0A6I1MH71_9CLOT|nr:sensor histidine kinase [Clostridium tarantellae]MPQ42725.1 HAMP domain-containing protein [Clostridium tarantellae]
MKNYHMLHKTLKYKSQKLRSISLKKRLIIFVTLSIIISLFFLGIAAYSRAKLALKTKAKNYSIQIANIMSEDIEKNKRFYERALSEFTVDEQVVKGTINYKFMDYLEKSKFVNYMNNFITSRLSLLPDLVDVEVVSSDYKIVYMQGFKYFKVEDIKKYAKKAENGVVWFYSNLNGQDCVCLARPIKSNGNIAGYVFMAIKKEAFASSFYLTNIGSQSDILLVDNNNKVIISKENFITDENLFKYKSLKEFLKEKSYSNSKAEIKIEGEKYLVNYQKLKNLDWYIVMLTNHNYINSEIKLMRKDIVIIALIFTILVGIISYFLYFSIKEPLYNLLNSVEKVSKGELNTEVKDEYKDEIGLLSRNFNFMVQRVSALLKETKTQQVEKRDLEIRMLQAQINPHFLFNTLNSLKWTALMNQDYVVGDGLTSLAELLRNTIVDKNELVSIKSEIENIKNYIVIQKLRYGDSFNINYEVEEELLNKKVIKFILQPIVENSILHGFEEDKSGQVINIFVKRKNNNILISIKDNGKGFCCNKEEKSNKLSGIGWNNVNERIKLTFGEEYGCVIESQLNVGTKVEIIIPIKD